jgi:hypothetical protein
MEQYKTFAEIEFEIYQKNNPNSVIDEFKDEIITLCNKFHESGQSGGSFFFVANVLSSVVTKLISHETINPLTGEDDEWTDITNFNNGELMFQNKRDSRVFKDGKNGKAYFLDAIIFNGTFGGTFTSSSVISSSVITSNGKIGSLQYIKSFPFTPKTFYIDVIDYRWKDENEKELDPEGHWWTHVVKDDNKLKEIFEYYDKYEVK